jgi:hypothetical protein
MRILQIYVKFIDDAARAPPNSTIAEIAAAEKIESQGRISTPP